MKDIYLILTYSGTVMSKFIRLATNDEFAHVSIALDKELKEMYSFGRINPYNPFFGGFVREGLDFGTFKRFENKTLTNIYTLQVTNYQYKKLKRRVKKMNNCKRKYKFNIYGLFAAKFRYKIKRKDSFYCAEFVKRLMDEAKIENNLPEVAKPEDFKSLNNVRLCYRGKLKNYKVKLNINEQSRQIN